MEQSPAGANETPPARPPLQVALREEISSGQQGKLLPAYPAHFSWAPDLLHAHTGSDRCQAASHWHASSRRTNASSPHATQSGAASIQFRPIREYQQDTHHSFPLLTHPAAFFILYCPGFNDIWCGVAASWQLSSAGQAYRASSLSCLC